MSDIFERATRKKLRLSSAVGFISAEQLWDLPLLSGKNSANLDDVARAASAELNELDAGKFCQIEAGSTFG